MNAKRKPAAPPTLDNFTALELLGTGGYADVFLYQEHSPRRRVAIKVLIADVIRDDGRRTFTSEANLMASVSGHPFIVQVFQAGVAADGRPYLVMEYYSGPNFLERARREQFTVADVLRVGIQVSSAVETAHRAGILHRDIKPANILTSEWSRPGLTDFGIAAAQGPASAAAEGLSIPWSPPEAFGAGELDKRADVYSLAATLYHLLAGRSPFEIPGASNNSLDLINRIERQPVPNCGRRDVPVSLERLLAHAMAKDPNHRPSSAEEFARALQGIESELRLTVTQLELADDGRLIRSRTELDDEERTNIRGITEVRAQTAVPLINEIPESPAGSTPVSQRPRQGLLAEPEVSDTIHRPANTSANTPPPSEPYTKRPLVLSLASVGVLAIISVVGFFALHGSSSDGSPGATAADSPNDGVSVNGGVVAIAPDVVQDLVGVKNADATFTFTWKAPRNAQAGDEYQVTEQKTADKAALVHSPQTELSIQAAAPCVEVSAVRAARLSAPTPKCVTG